MVKEDKSKKDINKFKIECTKLYLQYRMTHIDLLEYVKRTLHILNTKADENEQTYLYLLFRLYIYVISNNKNAEGLLLSLKQEEEKIIKTSLIEHAAFLYISALFYKDEEFTQSAKEKIYEYKKINQANEFIWFLFYLDDYYKENENRLKKINEMFNNGLISPIFYFEVINIYNKEPSYFFDLSKLNIHVINFAIKNNYLSYDLMIQFIYHANRQKNFHKIIFTCLTKLYAKYNKDEILMVICSMAIKGHKNTNNYFKYYQAGIDKKLRITRIYEYYMYSIHDDYNKILPLSILNYFIYNTEIYDSKKAFLYANIIKNNEKYKRLYSKDHYALYKKKIENFVFRLLSAKRFDDNIAALYNEYLNNIDDISKYLLLLTDIIFKHKIIINNNEARHLQLIHKETDKYQYIKITDNKAYIDLFSKEYKLVFLNDKAEILKDNVSYEIIKLIDYEKYINKIPINQANEYLLLNRLNEKIYNKNKINEEDFYLIQMALNLHNINERYYIDLILLTINSNKKGKGLDFFDKYLNNINMNLLDDKEIRMINSFCINNNYTQLALTNVKKYGFLEIASNTILNLFNQIYKMDEVNLINKISIHLFLQGKYNDEVLRVLIDYYDQSIDIMYKIFKASINKNINTKELEKRFILKSLNEKTSFDECIEVYLSFVKDMKFENINKKDINIIYNFLSYASYMYLCKNHILTEKILEDIRLIANYFDDKTCNLAYLKHLSLLTNKELDDDKIEYIDYYINYFYDNNIILSFFKKFKNIIKLPHNIMENQYIQLITDSNNKVFIHYCILSKEKTIDIESAEDINKVDFINEHMDNIISDIYVKRFTVFSDEVLYYYFTIENDEKSIKTKVYTLKVNSIGRDKSNIYKINEIIKLLEEDKEKAHEVMRHYEKESELAKTLLKPII